MLPTEWKVLFYQDGRGKIPVDEWIRTLERKDQARIFRSIELLRAYGTQLRMPYARHLRDKLWELRIQVSRNEYRILYAALVGRRFLLLHGFAKKTDKTPPREIEMAEKRLQEFSANTEDE